MNGALILVTSRVVSYNWIHYSDFYVPDQFLKPTMTPVIEVVPEFENFHPQSEYIKTNIILIGRLS